MCQQFPDEYWRDRDEDGHFPGGVSPGHGRGRLAGDHHAGRMFGGQNLGVSEAAMMMHTVGNGGGGMAAASTIQINLFGPHPILLFGTDAQKERWVPEPGAG